MDDIVQGRVRPQRTRADRPEVIMQRSIIIGHYEAGLGIRQISRMMGICRGTVRRWLRRYQTEGHVKTRLRCGGPRVTTPQQDQLLMDEAERNPLTTAVALTRNLNLQCHPTTTRRRLKEAGLSCCVPAKKEMLTDANKLSRLRFAQAYVQYDIEFWRSVIFTDEKTFSSVASEKRYCWRFKNARYASSNIQERSRSGRVSVSLHGWMCWSGPGELVLIDGNLNGEKYINILETSLLPSVRAYAIPDPHPIYLVQDRSPIHTSRAVKEWFATHPEIRLIDWPSKGCDCNPIENLWGIMVQEWEVEEKTKQQVERKAQEVWGGIRRTPDICSKLVDSLPSRLQGVIEAEGGWTKY